eukprot:CAMPEP_0194081184 /NCGR_PEP_ID=MMETSP0149-20130528/7046_1 /TAXON_ID=122233 /ORGANISM="Chaetoceros debilis, Strain MM31A-1" /LENGTH=489 /DNA_ID=CAMNT_0038763065 /DNA_START=119 /DNA_END=1588 /DNA_ORIENTATION=+
MVQIGSQRSKLITAAIVLGASACAFAPPNSRSINSSAGSAEIQTTASGISTTSSIPRTALSVLADKFVVSGDAEVNIVDADTSSSNDSNASNDSPTSSDVSEFLGQESVLPILEPFSLFPTFSNHEVSSSSSLLESFRSTESLDEKQREFELALGKALDTIKLDYPKLLTTDPDFSIYHNDIEVIDPSGVTLHSIDSYKASFQFLHMVIKLFYCHEKSGLTFRLVYDCARKNIRVSWNAELVPRQLYGGVRNILHVDGISVYEFDRESGLINRHRVEHLLVNDAPVKAPQGIFQAIKQEATQGPEGTPVWNTQQMKNLNSKSNTVLEFRPSNKSSTSTSLFSSSSDDMDDGVQFDAKAFAKKNAVRKKFGLQPHTPEEFLRIEIENKALEIAQQEKAASASAAAEMTQSKPKKGNFMNKLFGNVLKDTCETNWDCNRPELCCDFGFKKTCCSSGLGIFNGAPGELQQIPVQVVADDHLQRGGPGGDQYY